ncbi:MAG: SemiSWEET transporter [Ferruginibacter sp.]|nr:SemiSWEET family sugar transporter [Chitinophagaceae bacterium]
MDIITVTGLAAAVCTTTSFVPQAIKTIRTKDTSGISLGMYALFSFGTLLWLVYGISSYNLPIIIANAVTLLFALIILTYKIKYR